ncbi:MAG: FAD-dependent monooxygenase [Gordonia sp. (in: high G+C Gram-positive bacteria)]
MASVVIVGGGPVGSTLAVELARRGVQPVIIERRESISRQGIRARNLSIRTLELARHWGIADRLRSLHPLPAGWYRGTIPVTAVGGYQLTEGLGADAPMWSSTAPWDQIGSERPLDLPQYIFNEEVRRLAVDRGARLFVGWEVVEVNSDDAGVDILAQQSATGKTRRIHAEWVIGADGARSVVRRSAGITQTQTPAHGRMLNVTFRLPDAFGKLGVRPGINFMVFNRRGVGLAHPYEVDRWRIGMGPIPVEADPRDVDVVAKIADYLGADLRDEIDDLHVSTHLVNTRIADRLRAGRILLAGDAGVGFPPHLGQNLNHGVADAHSLGWMLAGVVGGWCSPTVFDAYEYERRLAAKSVTAASLAAARRGSQQTLAGLLDTLTELDLDTEAGHAQRQILGETAREVLARRADGVVYDQRFPQSPIVIGDGTAAPAYDPTQMQPAAVAGHRAPHVWLTEHDALSDLFGDDFTLLDLGDDTAATAPLVAAATRVGLPMSVVSVTDRRVRELYAARWVLIRPDRIVAWRGDGVPEDFGAVAATAAGARPVGGGKFN